MKASPSLTGRLAAGLNLASGIPAGFSIYVLRNAVVRGDPAATAGHILGAETLFRFGFVADLVALAIFVVAVILFRELLRPASRRGALILMCFGLMAATIQALNGLGDSLALLMLKGGPLLGAFTVAQTQQLAYQFVRLHAVTYDMAMLFYGFCAMTIGAVVTRSTFLPRWLGLLMVLDGLGYFTFGVLSLALPAVAARLYPFLPFATVLIGEGTFTYWLLVKGVDTSKWMAQRAQLAGAEVAAA